MHNVFFDLEVEANIYMGQRYGMVLCLARAPPQVCDPPGTNINFSHLRVNPDFQPKFFKTPYVPNGCIYRSTVLGWEDQVSKVSFDIILSKKSFREILKIFTAKS